MDWQYFENNTKMGPVPEETLRGMIESGSLPPNIPVWRDGLPNWVAANNVREFQNLDIRATLNKPQVRSQISSNQSKFEGFRTYSVGGYTYLMSYFEARFSGSGSVGAVADQFTRFVSDYATQGMEFFRCDEVPFRITPGCLAGLFGAKESYGHCTIVTFRKKME